MKKESRAKRMLAVALTIAMLLQNSASVLATDGAAPVSDALQEQSTELQSVNAASGQSDTGAQDGESADVQKEAKMSETQSSETSAPEADALQTAASETDALQTDTPKADIDETAASETKASETETSETATSGMDTPKTEATETDASETSAPQTDASKTDAPQTQETPGLTLPDSETDNEANDNELSEGTESGNIAETNTTETGNDTGTGSDTEIGNTTETEKNAETDTTRTETETMPTETTAQEQTETANANEADDSAETGVYTVRVENTSVQVKVRGEGVLPESSTMTAEAVATSDVDDAAQTIAERLHEEGQSLFGVEAFDITLLDENGAELHQLGGKVTVELEGLTVPEDAEQIRVYHVPETGEPEQVKSLAREELTDGILRFETDHFSVYAVAYVKSRDSDAGIMAVDLSIDEETEDSTLKETEDGFTVVYDGENHYLTLVQVVGEDLKNATEITEMKVDYWIYSGDDATSSTKSSSNSDRISITDGVWKLSGNKYKGAGEYTYSVTAIVEGESKTYTKKMTITRRPLYVVTPNISVYYYVNNHNSTEKDSKGNVKSGECILSGNPKIGSYFGNYTVEWPDLYLDEDTLTFGNSGKESIEIDKRSGEINHSDTVGKSDPKGKSKMVEYRSFKQIKAGEEANSEDKIHTIGTAMNTLLDGHVISGRNYKATGQVSSSGTEWAAPNTMQVTSIVIKDNGGTGENVSKNYEVKELPGTLEIKPVGRVRYNYVLGKVETVDGSAVEKELSDAGFPLGYMPQLGSEEYDSESEKPWIKSITTHLYRKGETFIVPNAEPTSDQYTFIGWYDKIRKLGEGNELPGAMRKPGEECSFCYDGDDLYTLDAVWMFLNGSSKEQIYDGNALALNDLEFNFTKGTLADKIYWQIEEQQLIELGQIQWAWGKDADKDDKATWTTYDKDDSETHPSQVNVGVYPVTIKANAKVTMSDGNTVDKELKIVRYITIYPRPITIQVGSKEYQFDGKTYTVAGEAGTGTGGLEYSFVETSDAPEGKYGLVSGDAFASNVLDVIYYPKDGSKTDYDTEGEKGFANRTAIYTAEINDTNLQNQPITLGEKECRQLSGEGKILQGDHDVTGNYYVILLPGELTITPADNTLTISKVVTGSSGETDKEFTFTVTLDGAAGGTSYNYYGSREGTIFSGGTIELKGGESVTIIGLPGESHYAVAEAEANQDGYKTTSANEEGTVSPDKEYPSIVTFTNSRDAITPELTVSKTLNTNGFDLKKNYEFSFTLTPNTGNPEGDPVAALSDGKITKNISVTGTIWSTASDNFFTDLLFTKTGTYTYTLEEDASSVPGIVNDKVSSHTVTVTVSAGVDGSGTLTAVVAVDGKAATEASFTNQYQPTAAQAVLSGSKVFAGALKSGSFTFELAGKKGTEPMPEGASAGKAVVTKEGAGDFQFGGITYTQAGTYEYTITEQEGTDESVLYDATVYDVTVTVSPDETTGRLAAVPVYKVHGGEDAEPGKAVFTNFIPQKRVTSPAAGESVKIGDEITYSIDWMNPEEVAADVTVTDVLAEGVDLVPEKSGGCSYDAATRTVTWTFENQAAGETGTVTLTVKVNAKARTSVTNRASLQVENDPAQTHTAKTSEVETPVATGNLIIRKIVSGNQGETDREFHFSVVVDPSVNGTYGEVTFVDGRVENIMLKSGESCTITGLPAGMLYTVSEAEANQDGYGTVAKNEKGTIPKNDTIVAEYTNRKPASAISLEGTKHYEGGELKEGQFTFVLTGEKDAPMPESGSNKVTNDVEGNFRFDEIIYNKEAVYHYTITEKLGTDAGILYDPTIYDVTVIVEPDSSTGYYKATAVYKVRNGKETQKAVFTNFAPKKSVMSPAVGESVKIGDEIVYSISWMNPGETAADVTVTDVLAEGVDLVPEKSSECSYDAATRTVTWALGSREAGTSGTVTLTVKVNAKARTSIANSAVLHVGNVAVQSEVRTAKTPDVKTPVASGGLIVTKTVTGTGGDTEKEFDFTVTVDAAINGVYGNMTFSNGVSQFKLKHGGKMEATELPAGITYSVTESGNEGYTVQKSGENGTIKESETAEAKFVNNKDADPQQAKPQQTESTPEPSPEPSTEPESEVKSSETEASTEPSTEPQTEPSKNTLAKLTVTKSIVNAGNRHLLGLDGAHFYVALFSDAAMTKQVGDTQKLDFDLNTAVASVTYKGLKPGTYYVSEVNADGKVVAGGKYGNGAYTASYTEEAQKVTISKGDRLAEFSFENQFFELPDEQYYQDLGLPQGETEPETEPDSETESEAETETKAQAEKQTEKQTEQETAAAVPKTAEAVKTGDETPIEWMMLLLAISGMLMLFAEKKRRARS